MAFFHVYKSSAGSGKTSILVKSFLLLALGSSNYRFYRKILAITFTNKAANEMKKRILSELEKISELDEDSKGFMVEALLSELKISQDELRLRARKVFNDMLQAYEQLSVSTIDRFNYSLIKSFSRELNLETDFKVETEEKKLFREAIDQLISKIGSDGEITKHLIGYAQYKLDDEKRVNIEGSLEKLYGLSIGEAAYDALDAYKNINPDRIEKVSKEINERTEAIRRLFPELGSKALILIQETGLGPGDFFQGARGVYGFFEKLRDKPLADLTMNSFVLKTLDEDKWTSKSLSDERRSAFENIKPQLSVILEQSKTYFDNDLKEFKLLEEIRSNIDLLAILTALNRCFDDVCKKHGVIPISRFNKIISDSLQTEPVSFIYEQIGTRYEHILIDEFQDTSQLQWYNLLPLIEESISKGKFSMVVGDAKQSIYRWRGGKAEQLIALPALFEPPEHISSSAANLFNTNSLIHRLNANYRSKANIVNFNNQFISALSSIAIESGSIYSDEYATSNFMQEIPEGKDGGYIELQLRDENAKEGKEWSDLRDQIDRCIESGYNYGDMAILVRSAQYEGKEISKYLIDQNIPLISPESFDIGEYPSVKIILSFLRLSYDMDNTPSVIQIMKGLCSLHNKPYDPSSYTNGKILDINTFLKDFGLPLFKPLSELSAFDAFEYVLANYLPNYNSPAVDVLKSALYDKFGIQGSISDFIEYWDELKDKPSINIGDAENCIQLMTIHKSKGLEFKIVFIPALNWNLTSKSPGLKWFPIPQEVIDLPFVPLTNSDKLSEKGLDQEWQKEKKSILFDNLNLIYVALTRAEDGLFINTISNGKSGVGDWLGVPIKDIVSGRLFSDFDPKISEASSKTTVSLGDLTSNSPSQIKEVVDKDNYSHSFTPWKTGLTFARKIENNDQRIGSVFHELISNSVDEKAFEKSLDRLASKESINSKEFKKLQEYSKALFKDTFYSEIISSGEIFQERELDYNGEIIRPDLVIIADNQISIIDFKTGEESDKNLNQVRNYMEACGKIEERPVKGYLIYLDPYRVIEVRAKSKEAIQTSLF